MALRMLQGEKPQDIPRVKGVNTYMFDWRAIKRWGLSEKDIPPRQYCLQSAAHGLASLQVVHHWRDCSVLGRIDTHFRAGLAAEEKKKEREVQQRGSSSLARRHGSHSRIEASERTDQQEVYRALRLHN